MANPSLLRYAALCIILLPLAGCGGQPAITGISGDSGPKISIGDAEKKWQAQNVTRYRIQVMLVQSIWHAQSHTITVRDGKVTDQQASCVPAPFESGKCTVREYKAEDFTVPGLFATARAESKSDDGKWTTIVFDPTYGYPVRISYDHPDVVDEDHGWSVQSFEVLK
jgi:hypothetical protein